MPYRVQARTRIGPAEIRRFDTTPFLERLQESRANSAAGRLAAQQAAAERKVAAQEQARLQREQVLKDTEDRIKARTEESEAKIRKFEQERATHQANQNRILARQNRQLRREQRKLGAPTNYSNNNFRGGDGRLVAVGGDASKKAAAIINEALKYRGRMYQWGGSTPQTSFDCSGLVQWAYKSMGVALPRVSADQARAGRKVPLAQLRPGDLVAWDNSNRNQGADHIAIYIGNGQIIEAPRTGQAIRVRALGNENAWGVQILK